MEEKLKLLVRSRIDEYIETLGISTTADHKLKIKRAHMSLVLGKLTLAIEIMQQIEPEFDLVNYCIELESRKENEKTIV